MNDADNRDTQTVDPQADQQARSDQQVRTERGDLQGNDAVELLPRDQRDNLQTTWQRIQITFVDQPRASVQQAHDLVGQLVDAIAANFTMQRDNLENTWSSGSEVGTEDLRVALQRYRALFNRLLSN